MRIMFLDFCLLILIVMALTQVIMPVFFPRHFDLFWLFRKDRKPEDRSSTNTGDNLRNAVKEAVGMKKKTDEVIKDARKKTKANLDDAKSLDKTLKDLK